MCHVMYSCIMCNLCMTDSAIKGKSSIDLLKEHLAYMFDSSLIAGGGGSDPRIAFFPTLDA